MTTITTTELIKIVVHGLPAPQGSKSAFRNKHTGKIQQVESSKAVAPWRQDVKHAAWERVAQLDASTARGPSWLPLDGPLEVSMVFSFARPQGHWRTGRNAGHLRDGAPAYPAGRPDLSKLARSTEDALTGVVWVDDARIVSYLRLEKHYTGTESRDVLTTPGCVVRVWSLPTTVHELRS